MKNSLLSTYFFSGQVRSLGYLFFFGAINASHIQKAIVDLLAEQYLKESPEAISFNSNLASDLMFQLKLNKHA